jgi:hypothetical protein
MVVNTEPDDRLFAPSNFKEIRNLINGPGANVIEPRVSEVQLKEVL